MSAILDDLAQSRYSHLAGTSGTATVPEGARVIGASCASTAGGTIVITPGGAGQVATALPTITVPAGSAWELPAHAAFGQLGQGSTIVFAGTDAYFVALAIRT